MGFRYLHKKGTFVDEHDREGVVEYRGMFLRKIMSLRAPINHDESVFHANEDHVSSWTENGRTHEVEAKGPRPRNNDL